MRVAIVSCVYPPEPLVSARTSAGLARALAAAGEDVTVIAPFPSRPAGKVYEGFRRRWRHVTRDAGLTVVRRFSTTSARSTMASRFLENVTFGLTSAIELARLPRPELVYLNSWPVLATSFCAAVARLRGVRVIVSVQDVYPESLVVQARIAPGGLVARTLMAIDRWIARRAAMLIVLTRSWRDLYVATRSVDPRAISVVPNWIDEDEIRPERAGGLAWRRAHGIDDSTFLVVYGGNLGVAAGVDRLVESFTRSAGKGMILLLAGDGSLRAECERIAAQHAPGLIRFHFPWRDEETSPVLSAADLLVLPTRGDQSDVSVPSKLISYLLAGRPVLAIASASSETAKVVSESGAGWVVAPGDDNAFAAALEAAKRSTDEEREARGAGGRSFAVANFGRAVVTRLAAIVRGAA